MGEKGVAEKAMADHKTDTMKGRKAKNEQQINDNAVKKMLVNLWPRMWTKAVLLMNVWAKWKCTFLHKSMSVLVSTVRYSVKSIGCTAIYVKES